MDKSYEFVGEGRRELVHSYADVLIVEELLAQLGLFILFGIVFWLLFLHYLFCYSWLYRFFTVILDRFIVFICWFIHLDNNNMHLFINHPVYTDFINK